MLKFWGWISIPKQHSAPLKYDFSKTEIHPYDSWVEADPTYNPKASLFDESGNQKHQFYYLASRFKHQK